MKASEEYKNANLREGNVVRCLEETQNKKLKLDYRYYLSELFEKALVNWIIKQQEAIQPVGCAEIRRKAMECKWPFGTKLISRHDIGITYSLAAIPSHSQLNLLNP